MVVKKRTVLNENRERVHVRWTAKCGNEIDLIGPERFKKRAACFHTYSVMGELVCSGQLWTITALIVAASQLQGRIARAFSSNCLVNTMDMTAVIQYILTAA